MKNKSVLMSAILSAMGSLGSTAVYAETAGSAAVLEEIVVTAQRREENLLDLPLSATAFNGDMLKNKGVSKIQDLQTASPSLSVTDTGPTLSVNIRGIGIATNTPNITAGVATYVDGLFQPPIVQSSSFYDIDTVEVLRGPQGTFVGNNATGGAIFINTKDPQLGEFGGYGEMSAGNYNNFGVEGAINIPLSDDLAIRIAGFKRDRDSYYEDIGPFDNDAGKQDEYSARLGVLWNPGNFEALFKAQTNKRDTGGYAAQPVAGTTYGSFRTDDAFTLAFDEDVSYEDEGDMYSLELNYELPNGVVLRSLSGYQDKSITNISDVDASTAPIFANGDIDEDYYANEKQTSQEINIISPTDGKFDWVVGGYYQETDIDIMIVDTQAGFPTDIPGGNERTVTGLFAQGNYELIPSLELQVGVRHSTYEVEGSGGIYIGRGIPGFPAEGLKVADLAGEYDDSRTTGKVALNWFVDDSQLVYAQVSTGYKPGGFNSATSEFAAEDVLSYELGWKFSAMDDRIRTQLTAFYNDYRDFQFAVLEPSTGVEGSENLADMTIKGLEAQVQARFGALSISGNIGYTQSDLAGQTFINVRQLPGNGLGPQCPAGVPSSPPLCFDYAPYQQTTSGGDALYAPEWTYNVSVSYEFELGKGLFLTPRFNYSHVDEQFTYLAYSKVSDTLESRDLVNASVTLTNDQWKVELYGTNLTDQEYVSGQFGTTEFYGAPREYGVRLGASF
ncbi:TonB-dependent receptor [Aestuariicella hydrocarbonica]|uniref:TonB-dependent receptor n=1 Tax=Pseudomaricurvus hydrocarbonicus TaxID=1470433 RepID=A0A9E5JWF2_9GAMM|nr:TonB-dependent receptor [Aestuariicella hydrocarbonica]NHO66130.1 TonB-dependent receptor [Aestuariicella hydrocarbonica]